MALSGWLAGIIGPAEVLILSGGICAAAGVIGICRARHAQRPLNRDDLLPFARRGTDPRPRGRGARAAGHRLAGSPRLDPRLQRRARERDARDAGVATCAVDRRWRRSLVSGPRARASRPSPSWQTRITPPKPGERTRRMTSQTPSPNARARLSGRAADPGRLAARTWILTVIGIFVLIFVLAALGIPSRFIPDRRPIPLPSALGGAVGSSADPHRASASASAVASASARVQRPSARGIARRRSAEAYGRDPYDQPASSPSRGRVVRNPRQFVLLSASRPPGDASGVVRNADRCHTPRAQIHSRAGQST